MQIPNDQTVIKEINTALSESHLNKYVSLLKIQHLDSHSQINYKLIDKVSKIRGLKEQILNAISEVSSKYEYTVLSELE